jgi:nucleotide-binding universal stress UspA family protein
MEDILVPTDFSGYADFAIASAAKLAAKTNAKITLLHVQTEDESTDMKAQEQIRLMDESGILKDVNYELKSVMGDPIEEIAEYPADIIVMGSRVVKGMKGFMSSTNTEKVAKRAGCPVFTLKHFVDLSKIETIVYPTDMRAEQDVFIPELKMLQKMYGSKIHLVKVYEDSVATEKSVKKRLREFANFHELTDYSIHGLPGMDEAQEIVHYAEEIDADLIAMATHERRGLERLIGGFISGSVLKHSRTSIFTKVVGSQY